MVLQTNPQKKTCYKKPQVSNFNPAEIEEIYSYEDERGQEIYQVVRFKGKKFVARHRLGDKWMWDKQGIREVLYKLPEVVSAEEVWVLEGEKDADNVQKLGFTATSSPFGKGNWKPVFTQALKDKAVNICLDKGAEKEAAIRAREIARVAKEVKIIELPGLTKEGQDISDWIDLNDSVDYDGLRERLSLIAQETSVYVPSKPAEKEEPKINNEFLSLYIESISKITDAPKLFILFSGLGLLSGILNKFYFHYPRRTHLNLYILLLAPSTLHRKSVCIDIASDYLSSIDTELLLPESFTTEALLDILSQQHRGLLAWRELIQVKEFNFGKDYNKGLPSLLTNIYDYKEEFRHHTKKEGEKVVKSPIISILAAGISDWLVSGLKEIDFQGGIWTRFLFIPTPENEEKEFKLPAKFTLNQELTSKLQNLNQLDSEEMNLKKILPMLEEWGRRHLEESRALSSEIQKANFQRLEVMLIKIACILQLAQNSSTTVEPETFKEAVALIENLKKLLMPFFEEEVKFTEFDKAKVKIKKILKKNKILKKSKILQKTGIPTKLTEEVLSKLIGEGEIKLEKIKKIRKVGRHG